uniref:Uncharacterized protein ORF5 n=1 Tax=Alternaria alternata TaxID=5599 RepID=C9K7B4_ALTAL|nr:hypothetical protein [Alternaria alternata]BAI44800.1 hypothetical protein [Alternaria alternata]
MSDFWKRKFKPAIQHVLDAQTDQAAQAALEGSFRRQSNNAAIAARWAAGKHFAQYLMSQETVYDLDQKLMPPQSVQSAARSLMRINEDGSMTALAKEKDADGDLDEEKFMGEEEAERWMAYVGSEDRQQTIIDGFWEILQPHWQQTYNNVDAKIRLLCDHSFDVYVEEMTGAKFKAYLDFIFNSYTDTMPLRNRRLALIREAWEKTTIRYKRDIEFDSQSELPVPPFSLLFRRHERVMIAIVLSAQLAGYYEKGGFLQLASKGQMYLLPPPSRTQTFSSRKFPYLATDAKIAARMLSEIGDPDNRPDDVEPYISLPQFAIKLEENGLSKELGVEDSEEEESDAEIDLYFDGTLSDFDQEYNSEDNDEVVDITGTTGLEKEYTREDSDGDMDGYNEKPTEESLQEGLLQEDLLQEDLLQEELLNENNTMEGIEGLTDGGDPMEEVESSGRAEGGDAGGK